MSTDPQVPSSKRKKLSSSSSSSSKGKHHEEDLPTSPEKKSSPSKPPFQRVFSEEDEIHLLKSFLDITKDSSNPATAAPLLFQRVGKSLSGEINQTQLIDKLRKLRLKYTKQVVDKLWIKNPHEREIFEISHKIWGGEKNSSSSMGSQKTPPRTEKKKLEQKEVPVVEENVTYKDEEVVDLEKNYSFLMEEMTKLPANLVLKEGLKCLGKSKLERFNDSWRLQQIDEAKILAQRAELIQEETKLILQSVVSQSPN